MDNAATFWATALIAAIAAIGLTLIERSIMGALQQAVDLEPLKAAAQALDDVVPDKLPTEEPPTE